MIKFVMMVNFIQPYAYNKDIHTEYNRACSLIPPGEWICITDQDSMFLHPESKKQIIDISQTTKFELLGCMTNRLNPEICNDQLVPGMFLEQDLLAHYFRASGLHSENYGQVKPTTSPIAGLLMLFRQETWAKRPFQGGIYFDQRFSEGLSKGIMEGVYMLHYYRFHKDINDTSHLKLNG